MYPKIAIEPEHSAWINGMVSTITVGYGSEFDGDVYVIALCDECIKSNKDRLEFKYNYIG